jgi:excisionase family DNA binding protein
MTQSDFLTTAEVAAILRVPTETVRYWRHLGKGPKAFKIPGGRRVLYARDDFDAWLDAEQGTEPQETPPVDLERRVEALEAQVKDLRVMVDNLSAFKQGEDGTTPRREVACARCGGMRSHRAGCELIGAT